MRVGIYVLLLAIVLNLSFSPACFAQEKGYFSQMGSVFTRGIKNIVSFPWEIPVTVAKHDREDTGNPRFYRDAAGFFDGAFRAVTRFSSGVWDVLFSVVPGSQDELSRMEPETFF